MAFNFSDEEEAGLQQLTGPEPQLEQREETADANEEVDDLLSEAERRYAQAQYYHLLLREQIFENDDSATAELVVEEIRGFIRERLSVLLGVKEQKLKIEEGFDEEEVTVLKMMAAKLLKKPYLGNLPTPAPVAPPKPKEPSLRRVGAPRKPKTKPVLTREEPERQSLPQPTVTVPVPKSSAGVEQKKTDEYLEITEKDPKTGQVTNVLKYKKMIARNQKTGEEHEYYLDSKGTRFIIAQNEAGEPFMRSIQTQAQPNPNTPRHPRLSGDMMLAVAARHAQAAQAQDPVASKLSLNTVL
jgi:hypothetical protein